ncbi:uncharacterized protein LOC114733535 [Neltuma alba]|uniref:uncharacterized protein LOC114733535 n=1 Tax=Neltuma alba TaxID=207710 RepID=UPI0010A580B0|nr:uncharacterized protein LOC114733535 [Prosopis alba]
MPLEMVGGAVLGLLFDQLLREIGIVKIIATFRPKLEELEETLDLLYPVVKEIEDLNRRLNRTDYARETIMLKRLLEDGTKLVSKCSKIPRWDFFKQSRQREKLVELDNKIVKFIILMQPHMGRDQKQTLLIAKETKQMLTSLSQNGHSSDLTMGLTASSAHSSYKTVFQIVLQVRLAWELHKIKAMRRLSRSNGIRSIPGEVFRRMREKFTMSTTPRRYDFTSCCVLQPS